MPPEIYKNGFGMEFLLLAACPGGFTMGAPATEWDEKMEMVKCDEEQHSVILTQPFYIGVYQVTQWEWEKVTGSNPSRWRGNRLPVERVSWEDCQEFIRRLNASVENEGGELRSLFEAGWRYALPTEAQWEYACRAGSDRPFAMTCEPGQMGWYAVNSGMRTHPVGELEPNDWGLFDMHGNVWEWCDDSCRYNSTNGVVQTDTYREGITDPICRSGPWRVCRGGSWKAEERACRSGCRWRYEPNKGRSSVGLRLVINSPSG